MIIVKDLIKFTIILILPFQFLSAQDFWSFEKPQINTPEFPISDTIYMAVDGNDSNDGSMNNPVETFDKAMELLPYGTPGINEGHAYGMIQLLPGDYVLEDGFNQNQNDYKRDNTYKNISVEGLGEVTLRGTKNQFTNGHMIKLIGSHISVKNINIKKNLKRIKTL